MLSSLSVLVSLAVLPFVTAQDNNLGVRAIEAHFEQSHIVEDYLQTFNPSALLTLNYAGVGDITPGQALTIPQVRPVPTVTVTPANSTVSLDGTYTIAMIDVDYVGADTSAGVTRHWLVNGVTVGEGNVVSNASATTVTPYGGPGPAAGSGSHRYIVALYQQPESFTPPEGFTEPLPIALMDWRGYVQAAGLGPLVAANYINVEEGTFTGSAVPTSAVVTSTLAAAASGSGASGASGSTRPTGSGASGSNAPEPTDDGSAARLASKWTAAIALAGGLALAL